jgi:hypothetical protein
MCNHVDRPVHATIGALDLRQLIRRTDTPDQIDPRRRRGTGTQAFADAHRRRVHRSTGKRDPCVGSRGRIENQATADPLRRCQGARREPPTLSMSGLDRLRNCLPRRSPPPSPGRGARARVTEGVGDARASFGLPPWVEGLRPDLPSTTSLGSPTTIVKNYADWLPLRHACVERQRSTRSSPTHRPTQTVAERTCPGARHGESAARLRRETGRRARSGAHVSALSRGRASRGSARASVSLREAHGNEPGHDCLRQGPIDGEVQRALRHRVAG